MKAIEIRDVGPVERLAIPVPDGGGVVVLRGDQGTGKSHSLRAVQSLVGGAGKPVTRDGALGAVVEGLGARLTLGRRASRAGELEVTSLDGEDPSLLVDPGLKGAEAADAERVRALLRLCGAQVDADAFACLVPGGMDQLRELCRPASLEARDGDVPAMASAIKRDLEAAARQCEDAAKNALAKAAGVADTLRELGDAGGPTVSESAQHARELHTAAVRLHSAAEARRRQAEQTAKAAADARGALAALGDDGTAAAVESAEVAEREADHRVEQLRAELAKASTEHELAGVRLAQQRKAAAQRERLQSAVDSAREAEPVTDAEIAELAETVRQAESEVQTWAVRERTAAIREEAETLQRHGERHSLEGAKLRQAAAATESVVLRAVRELGSELELEAGRLYVRTEDRGRELFADLSDGERWRMALALSARALQPGGLLVCRQPAWEGLSPRSRAEVAQHCRSLGIVLLTAEAADGELRAEVEMGARAVEAE